MNADNQSNSEQKMSNAFGNFSTSESTHSKNTNKASANQPESAEKRPLQLLELNQLQSKNNIDSKEDEQNDVSNRLFTFMDQREAERKIIQDYIFKNSFHKRSNNQLYQPKQTKHSNGIVRMIEDSRKKRQEFLKKVSNNTMSMKQNRSNSRLNRINRSKTPKHMPFFGNKNNCQSRYQTLQPRSRSKTPKLEPQKYNTPKAECQMKLFRAKSNLGKEKCKVDNQEHRDLSVIKGEQQILSRRESCLTERQLLRKKKELQRQLNAVNQTLMHCKKSDHRKKKPKTLKNPNRKSRSKLGKW